MNHGYIYVIKCPYTYNVVYVGQTVNPKARFCQHITSNNIKSPISLFILKLKTDNKLPIFEIVKKCKIENRWTEEGRLIKKLSKTTLLLNVQSNINYPQAIRFYLESQELIRVVKSIKVRYCIK